MARMGLIGTGPPMPCSDCRTPFTPSLVGSSRRTMLKGLLCPRCLKAKKARKKAKKQNG